MKTKRFLLALILFISSFFRLSADEGMWLPILLQSLNEKDMQAMGFRLTAEDIYSINHGSMKDAVVLFGNGCTAEIVSDQGLILTNHHCGFGQIQAHSSLENNYLANGFWSQSFEEELANPGLTASILVRMEDVTAGVMKHVRSDMTEAERSAVTEKAMAEIANDAVKGTHYQAQVKAFYYGNVYYLLVYEVFEDIRLVGAPPSSIGKFGGDTDNWMWPRHTGDFSVFRIYANKDNEPAKYNKNNQPYKPNYVFPISLKGVQQDDFTFVFGYPGSTEHFMHSAGVRMVTEVENPIAIGLRRMRMDVMEKYIAGSELIKIQYSAKLYGISNYWKKMIGESGGIERLDGVARKQAFEKQFMDWVNADPERIKKYGTLLQSFEETYKQLEPYSRAFQYFAEGAWGIDAFRYAYGFKKFIDICQTNPLSEDVPAMLYKHKNNISAYFKNYNVNIDREVAALMLRELNKMGENFLPTAYKNIRTQYKGNWDAATNEIWNTSYFTDSCRMKAYLGNFKAKKIKKLENDPVYKLAKNFFIVYQEVILPETSAGMAKLDSLYRIYVAARMEMDPDARMYPDANSTLRVAYGKVQPYNAMDAVTYKWFTTLEGIIEKEDPAIADYMVEGRLKELYLNKDYGQYADADGSLHVAFIATNHTTGGNSGSPVLNANGELIGINFDRVWEGTMSDLMFDPNKCRNISLDIRYCLFVIDKYAGASRLIAEMNIVR